LVLKIAPVRHNHPLALSLALLLVLAACAAPAAPPPPNPTPAPTPAPREPAEPAPAAPTASFFQAGDAAQQRDDLWFHGWSADGQRYAFETWYHGPGATRCEGVATLSVVDAARDVFVEGGRLELRHRDPEADVCDPPDLRAEMDRRRPDFLNKHLGGLPLAPPTPTRPIPQVSTRGVARVDRIELSGGRSLTSELEVQHGGRDLAGEPGASYTLRLSGPSGPALVVEPGVRRRPFVWDYDLSSGLVFESPDGRHIALLLATTSLSYEGDRRSYHSNGVALPAGW
jgi:hypothetical protein